ncbi:MAG: sodium/proton-translocating pyrophosphatase, partial [bacterium]|nr:sodium/proton-translocating pyrophosphatase [bacterium]
MVSAVAVSLFASVVALAFVVYLIVDVLKQDVGTEKMAQLSLSIQQGARAFLKREYIYVSFVVVVVAGLIAIAPFLTEVELGWKTSVAFVGGSMVSAL